MALRRPRLPSLASPDQAQLCSAGPNPAVPYRFVGNLLATFKELEAQRVSLLALSGMAYDLEL